MKKRERGYALGTGEGELERRESERMRAQAVLKDLTNERGAHLVDASGTSAKVTWMRGVLSEEGERYSAAGWRSGRI